MQHIIYLEKADVFRVAKNQEGESEKATKRKERKEEGYSPHIKRLVERSRERREAEEPVEKARKPGKSLDFGMEKARKLGAKDLKKRKKRGGDVPEDRYAKWKKEKEKEGDEFKEEPGFDASPFNRRGKYLPMEKSGADKFIVFLDKNPNPPDKKIHALAERLGVEHDKFEAEIYSILSDVIEHGKGGPKPDPKELAAGIKVESEHTKHPALAKYIALAHLKEIPDYYARLKVMEDQAKAAKK